jgi:hypothetical protein
MQDEIASLKLVQENVEQNSAALTAYCDEDPVIPLQTSQSHDQTIFQEENKTASVNSRQCPPAAPGTQHSCATARKVLLSRFKIDAVPEKYRFDHVAFTLSDDDLLSLLVDKISPELDVPSLIVQWAGYLDQLRQALLFRGQEPDVESTYPIITLFLNALAMAVGLSKDLIQSCHMPLKATKGGVRYSGYLDLVRTDPNERIAHHYEIKRTRGDTSMETSPDLALLRTLGQNYTLSLMMHEEPRMDIPWDTESTESVLVEENPGQIIVRGLCTDSFFISTCWYAPSASGCSGVQYTEERVMAADSCILRLLFSFYDYDPQVLLSLTLAQKNSLSDGDGDPDDEESEELLARVEALPFMKEMIDHHCSLGGTGGS